MKTFPLRLPGIAMFMSPAILGILTLAGAMIPFAPIQQGQPNPAIFAIFWFGILGYGWYRVLSLPRSIALRDDGCLEFRSLLGTREVKIANLISIEPESNQFGFFRIRHSGGSISVLLQFDGFHQLAATIREKNPRVKVLGC